MTKHPELENPCFDKEKTASPADNADFKASAQPAGPCAVVIFGANGDLTKRKLLPALYNLATERLLPANFAIVGISRTAISREDYQNKVVRDLTEFSTAKVDATLLDW